MVGHVLRKLARDQWVRLHGTPRVTVLVGGVAGREIWEQWVAVAGVPGALLAGGFDEAIREAVARAAGAPAQPIAVLVGAEDAARWRAGRQDRLAAMVDEGWVAVGSGADAEVSAGAQAAEQAGSAPSGGAAGEARRAARPAQASHIDARSVAEATLFEALEATAATAGRFTLNESLSVRFGGAAAEVDLLSRDDRVAIEIDGFHHFADLDGYRRDRKKDVLLQGQGLFVVRVLAEDVMRDARAAVNTVCQALAYRRKEQG